MILDIIISITTKRPKMFYGTNCATEMARSAIHHSNSRQSILTLLKVGVTAT